jgi:hypothetical protein
LGYTGFTKGLIQSLIDTQDIKTVIDLGAQNNYDQPNLPAPYISEWYKEKGISYECIDLNGENGAIVWNLGEQINLSTYVEVAGRGVVDLVVDAGTSEHVGKDNAFDWEAIYNCWLNKFNLCKEGGYIVSENPLTGNWPGHGFNYYTAKFYVQLQDASDLIALEAGTHPAMWNTTDGWNVYCVMKKTGGKFPDLETFKTFSLKTA